MTPSSATLNVHMADLPAIKSLLEQAAGMAEALRTLGEGGDINYEAARGYAEEWDERLDILHRLTATGPQAANAAPNEESK